MTVPKGNTFSDHAMYRLYDHISTPGNILFWSYLKYYHILVKYNRKLTPSQDLVENLYYSTTKKWLNQRKHRVFLQEV